MFTYVAAIPYIDQLLTELNLSGATRMTGIAFKSNGSKTMIRSKEGVHVQVRYSAYPNLPSLIPFFRLPQRSLMLQAVLSTTQYLTLRTK
jgi:hypothetical protein